MEELNRVNGRPNLVRLTHAFRPRIFLEELCFTQAIREAARIPEDPEWLRIFQRIAPDVDWSRARQQAVPYEPPRWIGYWYSFEHYWASDGLLRLQVRRADLLSELFEELRRFHFGDHPLLPFVRPGRGEPSHMLLHDTTLWRVYVESFEQAEAALVRQPRCK